MKKFGYWMLFIVFGLISGSCVRRSRLQNIVDEGIVSGGSDFIHNPFARDQYEKALSSVRREEWEKARRYFMNADSAEPNNPGILTDLGNITGTIDGADSSFRLFDKAISIDSTMCRTYLNYGYWLNNRGRYRDAIIIMAKGISISKPSTSERSGLYLNLADSYHELGKDSLALRALYIAKQGLESGPLLKRISLAEDSYRQFYGSGYFNNIVTKNDPKGDRETEYRRLKNTDDLGSLRTIIDFKIRTKNLKEHPDGYIPSISINHAENEINDLVDKDDEPSPFYMVQDICILYDYPMKNPCIRWSHFDETITKKVLVEAIAKNYRALYAEEEQTATIKTIPVAKRTDPHRRNETNGKYGIWSHDLDDLRLLESTVFIRKDGSLLLTVKIEN